MSGSNFTEGGGKHPQCFTRRKKPSAFSVYLRRPGGGEVVRVFTWISFLTVKQNQQDLTYSYLGKQQIGKKSRISKK